MQPRLEGLEDRVVLSTFQVNTTLDTVAVNLKNGKDATGHISLRSAIMAADARGQSNTIIVPAGTFTLTIAGASEDDNATGDLDINGNVTIKGRVGQHDHRRQQPGSGLPGPERQGVDLEGDDPARPRRRRRRRDPELRRQGDALLGGILNNVAVGSNGTDGAPAWAAAGRRHRRYRHERATAEGGGIFNAAGSLSITKSTIASQPGDRRRRRRRWARRGRHRP